MSDARLQKGMTHSPDATVDDGDTPAENSKARRKRQSQSCDACRARKVRCARDQPDDSSEKSPCKHCASLGIPCKYDYQPKKRGPPNLYLRRLQEAAAAAASATPSDNFDAELTAALSSNFTHKSSSSSSSSSSHSPFMGPDLHLSPALEGLSTPTPRFVPSNSVQHPYVSMNPPQQCSPYVSSPACGSRAPGQASRSGASQPFYAVTVPSESYSPQQEWPYKCSAAPTLSSPTIQPLSYFYRPHRLETIAPREIIFSIMTLFFDFVYPRMPCVHKPSFMADLQSRREERDPLFFALLMSTVASTLVQVPRSYLPLESSVVRSLAQRCYNASRLISVVSYEPPSLTHVVIRFLDSMYHLSEGTSDASQHAAFGEAVHLALTLRMHEETSYEALDAVECEIRRRTFWLLYGADKSMAVLLGRPVCLPHEDCTVELPKELDDEYITPGGYLRPPHSSTPIICGLVYVSRIFIILGDTLSRMRSDKRSPPSSTVTAVRLQEMQSQHSRLLSTCLNIPDPLRLKQSTVQYHMLGDYGVSSFHQATFAELRDFFENPNASREHAINPFLVMQANIYVTQQLVRFIIELYWEKLLMTVHDNMHSNQSTFSKELIASDMLNILYNIPIQSIATNGPCLVHKVRYVASVLLNPIQRGSSAPPYTSTAYNYLWTFLSILSEIEKNYLIDEEHPSGDGMRPS